MKKNWEAWGLGAEALGLLFILGAGAWQVFFTDWFEKQSVESFYRQSQSAQMAILSGIRDTSYALANAEPEQQMRMLNDASDRIGQAVLTLVDDSERRRALEKSQAETFKSTRFVVFALGSILIVFGKLGVRHHKLNIARVSLVRFLHPVLLFRKQKFERVSDKPKPLFPPRPPPRSSRGR
ncbi:MAG: hypothetical protein Q7K57_12280 [Burkholderiaceae bacterium]|nr:hypothetical protein [Burkholderiaceae bacterium]